MEQLRNRPDLFSHALTRHIPPNEVSNVVFDFAKCTYIPCILVFLMCNNLRYKIWDGSTVDRGKCTLLLRRNFEVGAMKGEWSAIAGVFDATLTNPNGDLVATKDLENLSVLSEITDETGFSVDMIRSITRIGSFDQRNPSKLRQVFGLTVFVADLHDFDLTPRVAMDYSEHMNGAWVQIDTLRYFCTTGAIDVGTNSGKMLAQILNDGITESMPRAFQLLFGS